MARVKLTAGRIREFECSASKTQEFLRDLDAPGLGVRATVGTKAFIFQSKLAGQDLRITIGDVKVWLLDAARAEARRLQTLIDQGVDPRQEKAERIAATEAKREEARRVEAPALEAWTAYIEARRPRWGARHLATHEDMSKEGGEKRTRGRRKGEGDTTQPGILRPLLLLPLSRIDAACVRTWLEDETARRATLAALAFRLLRAFLNWCSDRPEYREQVHADACAPRLAKETLPKPSARDDCLQKEQIRPWFAEVKKLSPIQSAYLQVVLAPQLRHPGGVVRGARGRGGSDPGTQAVRPGREALRRRPLDLLRMWHTKIEGWILEQAGIEQPGEGQAPGLRVVG
jgi:hypothetical protein